MIWNGWKRNTVREVQGDRKGGGARRIREGETTFNRPHICVQGWPTNVKRRYQETKNELISKRLMKQRTGELN